jgi:beta-1,4-mannosyltransferase
VKGLVSIIPARKPGNLYVDNFADAVRSLGYDVSDGGFGLTGLLKARTVIQHWPNAYFDPAQIWQGNKNLCKMRLARWLGRTKFVWIAHNVVPHDVSETSPLARRYVRQLDGIVHLSHAGRALVEQIYDVPARTAQLVTVHGIYRSITSPALPRNLLPLDQIRAVTVGQIKPYKNLEAIIDASRGLSQLEGTIQIVGKAPDLKYAHDLETMAANGNASLRFELDYLSDTDMEEVIDASDLVLLPYKRILNSGSAFRALSRYRPIVAPNMGSLPELRDAVGSEWVYLYRGAVDAMMLRRAFKWVRETRRTAPPNLTNYGWERVSRDLRQFFVELSGST